MSGAKGKIAVLTSGGDAPGMNAAIRAVVRTGIARGYEVYGVRRGYNGILKKEMSLMSFTDVSEKLQHGGTFLFTARSAEFGEDAGKRKAAAAAAKSGGQNAGLGNGGGSSSGNAVASFASQFVGNPYVYGGTSLTNGADCSGFVMSVYANFGVGLPHSSSAMRGVGYGVSLSEAQPGDIICYSGHVAIYCGNNTIVHASTAATGIKYTSPANYKPILAVRRIF